MELPIRKIAERPVLSVSARITYAAMTEHNVYSCPDSTLQHDLRVDDFAPRNERGKIPRVYRIAARIVTDPKEPIFPEYFHPDYVQNIRTYISAVKGLKGILDGGGMYRFYVLTEPEDGMLKHAPSLEPDGPEHVYLSMKELVSGSSVVHAIR